MTKARRWTIGLLVTAALLSAACGESRTTAELLTDACTDVNTGRWIEARDPLKVAAERDPSLSRLYSLVRASAEPADPPQWAIENLGPRELAQDRAPADVRDAWRSNARSWCQDLGH